MDILLNTIKRKTISPRFARFLDVRGDRPVRVEKVAHFLVVDLHVGHLDLEGEVGSLVAGDVVEEGVAEARDDPTLLRGPHHRVRLAGPWGRDGGQGEKWEE